MPRKASMLSLESDPAIANFIHATASSPAPTVTQATPPPARPRKPASRPKEATLVSVARGTYKVDANVHYRLKLLALKKRRNVYELANEALLAYLKAQGAE